MFESSQSRKQKQSNYPIGSPKTESPLYRPAQSGIPALHQRQAVSNQARQRFAYSCPLVMCSPNLCPPDGVCHACQAPRVLPKLKFGQTNDKYEQEADRVAEQIIGMPEFSIQKSKVALLRAISPGRVKIGRDSQKPGHWRQSTQL